MYACITKNGGPRCVTYFKGSRDVAVCDRGKGESKMVQNSVTYFMDGPKSTRGTP